MGEIARGKGVRVQKTVMDAREAVEGSAHPAPTSDPPAKRARLTRAATKRNYNESAMEDSDEDLPSTPKINKRSRRGNASHPLPPMPTLDTSVPTMSAYPDHDPSSSSTGYLRSCTDDPSPQTWSPAFSQEKSQIQSKMPINTLNYEWPLEHDSSINYSTMQSCGEVFESNSLHTGLHPTNPFGSPWPMFTPESEKGALSSEISEY